MSSPRATFRAVLSPAVVLAGATLATAMSVPATAGPAPSASASASASAAIKAQPSGAAATTPPESRIFSAARHTCLDASTTGRDGFLDTYGRPCSGSTAQSFAFHALSTGPASTYEIVSQSTSLCLDQYRFAIRQESCTGSVPPDYSNVEWTLQRVGNTGYRYLFVDTNTVGTPSPRCVQVYPKPNGYPGAIFDLTFCNTNESAQVLTLSTAP